jgi:hypothetical protein
MLQKSFLNFVSSFIAIQIKLNNLKNKLKVRKFSIVLKRLQLVKKIDIRHHDFYQ